MSVAQIINRRDVGTLASFQLQAREAVCLSEPVCLAKGRVHEVMGDSADMFAVLTASRLTGPIIWIGLARDIGSLAPVRICANLADCKLPRKKAAVLVSSSYMAAPTPRPARRAGIARRPKPVISHGHGLLLKTEKANRGGG